MAYIDNANGFRCIGTLSGSRVPTRKLRLAVNQTIHAGDFLYASSGYLIIATSTATPLVGLATEDCVTGASDTPWIDVILATPDVLFVGQCSGTPTIATLMTSTGISIEGTTGIMEIDEDDTDPGVLQPFELWDKDEGYGANARLICFVRESIWTAA